KTSPVTPIFPMLSLPLSDAGSMDKGLLKDAIAAYRAQNNPTQQGTTHRPEDPPINDTFQLPVSGPGIAGLAPGHVQLPISEIGFYADSLPHSQQQHSRDGQEIIDVAAMDTLQLPISESVLTTIDTP